MSVDSRIFADIANERRRQDEKWGPQRHSWVEWTSVLTEEVGEAATEANKAHWFHSDGLDLDGAATEQSRRLRRFREELVQVAAVAVAAIEHLDERLLAP